MNTLHRALGALERFAGRQADVRADWRTRLQVMLLIPMGILMGVTGLLLLPFQGVDVLPISLLATTGWIFFGALPLVRQGRFGGASSVALYVGILSIDAQVTVRGDVQFGLSGLVLIMAVAAWMERTTTVATVSAACIASTLCWPLLTSLNAREFGTCVALATVVGVISVVGNFTFSRMTEDLRRNLDANATLAKQLAGANEELELRVADRTEELLSVLTRQRQLTAELDELSQRDDLTGLYNRRRLVNTLADPVMRNRSYSLLMADIDHFKRINDSHGHGAGDQVLQRVAHALAAALREQDVLARIGGEEFAVLLPFTAQADAASLGERLRSAVSGLQWDTVLGQTDRVTISVGVAGTDKNPETPQLRWEHLLQLADQALYQAKRSGRDRVVTAGTAVTLPTTVDVSKR